MTYRMTGVLVKTLKPLFICAFVDLWKKKRKCKSITYHTNKDIGLRLCSFTYFLWVFVEFALRTCRQRNHFALMVFNTAPGCVG